MLLVLDPERPLQEGNVFVHPLFNHLTIQLSIF